LNEERTKECRCNHNGHGDREPPRNIPERTASAVGNGEVRRAHLVLAEDRTPTRRPSANNGEGDNKSCCKVGTERNAECRDGGIELLKASQWRGEEQEWGWGEDGERKY
jgi:hypothetical protein